MGKFKKAHSNGKGLSHPAVKVLALLNIILLGVGLYIYFRDQSQDNGLFPIAKERVTPYQDSAGSDRDSISLANEQVVAERDNNTNTEKPIATSEPEQELKRSSTSVKNNPPPEKKIIASRDQQASPLVIQATNNRSVRYTVAKGQAHFHNQPDPSTRRKAFINHWNKAVLQPLDEQNGFIYIVYTNHLGQTSKGWLQIQDLKPLPDK